MYTVDAVELGKTGEGSYGPWQSVVLTINGEKRYGFADPPDVKWNIGDELDIQLFEESDRQGKVWKKFKVVKGSSQKSNPVPPNPLGGGQLDRIEKMLAKVLEAVSGKAPGIAPPSDGPPLEDLTY